MIDNKCVLHMATQGYKCILFTIYKRKHIILYKVTGLYKSYNTLANSNIDAIINGLCAQYYPFCENKPNKFKQILYINNIICWLLAYNVCLVVLFHGF
jgi:hypothetical protein